MYKVVIADDEQMIRAGLLSLEWESNNMEIVGVAKNGIEAQEIIDSVKFDILLTDIRMPGIGGLELANNLLAANPMAKTILLSGYGEFEYAKRAIKAEVFEYILKPSTPAELIECANRACQAIKEEQDKQLERNKMQAQIDSYEELIGSKNVVSCSKDEKTDINEMLRYIYKNYEKPLTLSVLAEHCHFSSVYLSHYIKKYTGHTFLEILTSVRMYHAAKLLKETKLRNNEIGCMIGITDERYFGQVFKKTYGVTPNEYRKSNIKLKVSLDEIIKQDEIR